MTDIKDLIAKIKRMGKDDVFLYGADESLTSVELNALVQRLEKAENDLARERQFICVKCGLREELGTKTEPTF